MRSVSRRFRRSAVLFVLVSVLVAQGAAAKGRGDDTGFRERFERAKRVIVTILSRFGWPPGEELPGRLNIPPEDE
jgi:hypothetical protein